MIKRNFVFTVSLVAMFAVSSAWADAATGNAVGTAHTVYDNSGLNMAESGIAGVTYVNRMVNAAGNSAQKAEAHAASAGASALSAAADAKEAADAADAAALAAQTANNTLANKQDKLVAGSNITIAADGKTISATDTKYSAGSNISLSGTTFNVPTANGTNLGVVKQGSNITISDEGVISVNTTATPAANSTVPLTAGGAHTALGTKQDTIDDLADIRTGAAAGATALQKADITTGSANGTISVDGSDVSVKGLGTAAYANTTAFDAAGAATAAQTAAINAAATDAASKYQDKDYLTSQSLTTGQDNTKYYTSVKYVEDKISAANSSNAAAVAAAKSTADSALAKANAAVVANAAITAGTGSVITYDAKGLVTSGRALTAADIPAIEASKVSGLASVATSGSYNDLSNKPAINNATLTIKNGATGSDLATFTANASSGATATIPAATASVAGLARYGQIPSGSETSSTYASIWVE